MVCNERSCRFVFWPRSSAPASTAEHELSDYHADPLETRNVAADRPEVLAKLKAVLERQPEAAPQPGQQ